MLSLQRKIKYRNTAVKTIEQTYEQKSLKKFEKLCCLNSEIEGLAEDAENNGEIYDHCLQSEVNITKKINTLKSTEKGMIKNSDTKSQSFKRKFVYLPKLTVEKFKGDYAKFNTFMDSFVAAIDSCKDLRHIEKLSYLHSYLESEAHRTIQGIKLADKTYPALEVLRRKYGYKTKNYIRPYERTINIKKVERDGYIITAQIV